MDQHRFNFLENAVPLYCGRGLISLGNQSYFLFYIYVNIGRVGQNAHIKQDVLFLKYV